MMRIIFTAAEDKVGGILALLTAHQVGSIDFEVIEQVLPGTPRVGGRRAPDVVLAAIAGANGRPIHANELGEALKAAGMAAGSISSTLTQLYRAKLVKRVGRGFYALTHPSVPVMDMGEETAGLTKHAKPRKKPASREITGSDFILKLLGRSKEVHKEMMREHFKKDGRSPSSVDSALSALVNARKVKRIDAGTYTLMRKPAAKPAPKKKPAAKKKPALRAVETEQRAAA